MIVTIDGPAGTGKSTVARGLASKLGFEFLDTGAMYRVVALSCLRRSVSLDDSAAVAVVAHNSRISLDDPDRKRAAGLNPGNQRDCPTATVILLNGEDVTEAIRRSEVTEAASVVATNPAVRDVLVSLQRRLAEGRNIVSEGRDQGTVAFPHADCKFYLTAEPHVRARRRRQDLRAQGEDLPIEEIARKIEERDHRDETRTTAPLKPADDAILIDTSHMTADEVITHLERHVREVLKSKRNP